MRHKKHVMTSDDEEITDVGCHTGSNDIPNLVITPSIDSSTIATNSADEVVDEVVPHRAEDIHEVVPEEEVPESEVVGRRKNYFVSITRINKTNQQLFFLQDDNLPDKHLLRVMLLKQPWAGGYGKVTKLWEESADLCMEQKDEKGKKVFDGKLCGKIIKERFKLLLKWIKSNQNDVAFRSGTDDEAPPGEIMRMLEEVLELVTDFEGSKEEAQKEKTEKKKRMREEAQFIREASMGNKSLESLRDDISKRSKESSCGSGIAALDLNSILGMAASQLDETPKKQQMAERRLLLSEEKLKLAQRKFEVEEIERKARMEEDCKRNEQTYMILKNQMEMQRQMMEMIMKFKDKKDK